MQSSEREAKNQLNSAQKTENDENEKQIEKIQMQTEWAISWNMDGKSAQAGGQADKQQTNIINGHGHAMNEKLGDK